MLEILLEKAQALWPEIATFALGGGAAWVFHFRLKLRTVSANLREKEFHSFSEIVEQSMSQIGGLSTKIREMEEMKTQLVVEIERLRREAQRCADTKKELETEFQNLSEYVKVLEHEHNTTATTNPDAANSGVSATRPPVAMRRRKNPKRDESSPDT